MLMSPTTSTIPATSTDRQSVGTRYNDIALLWGPEERAPYAPPIQSCELRFKALFPLVEAINRLALSAPALWVVGIAGAHDQKAGR